MTTDKSHTSRRRALLIRRINMRCKTEGIMSPSLPGPYKLTISDVFGALCTREYFSLNVQFRRLLNLGGRELSVTLGNTGINP